MLMRLAATRRAFGGSVSRASDSTEAELIAVLVALICLPTSVSLRIVTDSDALIKESRTRLSLPRGAVREVVRTHNAVLLDAFVFLRSLRLKRGATVVFAKVAAHTSHDDCFSCGNRAADAFAKSRALNNAAAPKITYP